MSINFVICSYGGEYASRHYDSSEWFKKKYLHFYLLSLNSIWNKNSLIDKITIMRPKINKEHKIIEDYYDFSSLDISNIKDKIQIIECENRGISYGQFFTAIENDKNNLYDYYIFTEDDYIPFLEDFDKILIDSYDTKNPNFLCLSVNYLEKNKPYRWDYYGKNFIVPDFSIGILNKKSIEKIYETYSFESILNLLDSRDCFSNSQIIFGYIFNSSGLEVKDLSEKYMSLFNCNSNPLKFLLVNLPTSDRYIQRIYKGEKFQSPLFIPIDIFFLKNREEFNILIKKYLTDIEIYEKSWDKIYEKLYLN